MNDEFQVTFYQLQRLTAEQLHELGDLLLPSIGADLAGLKKYGLNTEGKIRKGTPDSFSGDAPATCRVAVEYSTQADDLGGKLKGDYVKVRKECPQATVIVLCVNRAADGLDLSSLEADASSNRIDLRVIDGHELTRALCHERQDLRARFLGIPIDAHTFLSLVRIMGERLDDTARGKVENQALSRFVLRGKVERVVREATHRKAGESFLLVAPAGSGKTTWSFEYAKRFAGISPVTWLPATDLVLTETDPISLAVVQAAYGSADAQRVNELAELLRREQRGLLVILDGIDETRDYAAFTRCLKAFRVSRLSKLANVLMTCRDAALPLLKQELGATFPDLFYPVGRFNGGSDGSIQFPELDQEQAIALLRKAGATAAEAREVRGLLPEGFRGNALFLLRSLDRAKAGLPAPSEQDSRGWIEAFSDDFITDIARRMQAEGRRPTRGQICIFLEAVALKALDSPGAVVDREQLLGIAGADEDGESTLLERAIQAGLLARRNLGVGFTHAVYFEYFAAAALSRDGDITNSIERLRGDGAREVLIRLVTMQSTSDTVVKALLERVPIAACEVAARLPKIADPQLRQAVVEAAATLLAGHFLSDRAQGVRLLADLKWPESTRRAVDWFNALPSASRGQWLQETAGLFLSHEEIGGFSVIISHRGLAFDWYEPSFIRRMSSLTRRFRDSLVVEARKMLTSDDARHDWARPRLTKLLGILSDSWLVHHLRERLANGPLEEVEYRALIHLNTYESILLYAESVEKCWELERMASELTPQDAERARTSMYDRYMLKGTDILMFEHDVLKDLVASTLATSDLKRVSFAHEWAAFLGDEELLIPAYQAMRRFPGRLWIRQHELVANIIKDRSASEAVAMYARFEDTWIRGDIVHCMHEAPGPETAAFLCERLAEEDHQFSAIQSLGIIGALNAAPVIQLLLKSKSGRVRHMAADVLGKLRYAPAAGDLTHAMKSEHLHGAARSLGLIGGPAVYRALAACFDDAEDEDEQREILEALVRRRDPDGIGAVNKILANSSRAREMIASAVGQPDFHERPNDMDDLGPLLRDPTLLGHVLASAKASVASGRRLLLDFSLRGVASFDDPAAIQLLEEIAQGTNGVPQNDSKGGSHDGAQEEARRWLALRGHAHYPREAVDRLLDGVRADIPSWSLPALAPWPRAVVRGALLERVSRGEQLETWLELLQFFAEESDDALFRTHETHPDEGIADLCHRFLRR